VAFRSLLVPGAGQITTGRVLVGAAFALGATGAFVFAQSRHQAGEGAYRDYLEIGDTPRAVSLYDQASDARSKARAAVLVGVAVWGMGVVEAAFAEHRHAGRVRSVNSYGRRLSVSAAPTGAGLTLGLSF
jgi:hypothetical protein